MVGISDYRPVDVPDGMIELRVHGVSGTPPEALIKQTANLVAGTATAGFYRHDPTAVPQTATSRGVREGYAWGGLTSGSRITSALRLLLLPFSFVNVGGWMVPGVWDEAHRGPTQPDDPARYSRRIAAHALASRLLAASLTVLVSLGALWTALRAGILLPHRFGLTWLNDGKPLAIAALSTVILVVGVWVWVAQRRAEVPPSGMPSADQARSVARGPVEMAAKDTFDVSRLWQIDTVTKRLSGIHAALAIASCALVSDAVLGGDSTATVVARLCGWLAVALSLAGIVALAIRGAAGRVLTRVVRWSAVPAAAGSVVFAAAATRPSTASVTLVPQAEMTLAKVACGVAVAVLLLVVAQWAAGPAGGPAVGRLYAGAFTIVGFGTALTGMVGLVVLATYGLSGSWTVVVDEVLGAMAQAIAIVGIVAVSVLLIVVLLQLNIFGGAAGAVDPDGAPLRESVARFQRLRATVADARGAIVAAALVFAVGANAVIGSAVYAASQRPGTALVGPLGTMTDSGGVGWAAWGWVVLAAVVGAILAGRFRRVSARAIGMVVLVCATLLLGWCAATLIVAVTSEAGASSAWTVARDSSDEWFVTVAFVGACLTPAVFVVAYMGWGSRDQGIRRSVGIIWDLVDFWPRQFHPWAPPPYTDTTIPELSDRVRELARSTAASHVVVSAHSQGAIIAVPALSRLVAYGGLTAEELSRVCLLTYGQLLDVHYRWLFPWIFNPTLFAQVDRDLGGRWFNLFRTTDPLGHPVQVLDDVEPPRNTCIDRAFIMELGPTTKPKTLNHGDYWYSQPQYPNALLGFAFYDSSARSNTASAST